MVGVGPAGHQLGRRAAALSTRPPQLHVRLRARDAVMVSFFLNGFGFATWLARIPEARRELSLSNGELGVLLLAIAAGSVLTLPTTGALINRFGAALVVRAGVVADVVGLAVVAVGAGVLGDLTVTAVGLFLYGLGVGVWDVGMNVEGAAVERTLGRSIMPRFHAAFSLGTVAGAGLGALTVGLGVDLVVHLGAVAVVVLVVAQATTGDFLPATAPSAEVGDAVPRRSAWAAWLEPRTLVIGVMVFALALTEGTANDWLALALIDGHRVEPWVGVSGFALFVGAMTVGRLVGPV
ncbi:hypothetical protein, partial [Nocardioides sp.]|uniref:hypothetical protein n=1 Tax=Nocardioides sp. TaxID=35761 RepID=UPI002732675B